MVLLKVKRTSTGFTLVLLRGREKPLVLQWFCLGSNEKALVLQWFCFGSTIKKRLFYNAYAWGPTQKLWFYIMLLRVKKLWCYIGVA